MEIFRRRETLEKILISIFGITTVNFNIDSYERGEYGEVIINQNGLFDKNSYTLRIQNNYNALFDITFNTCACKFIGKNMSGYSDFNRDRAINNILEYFRRFGIQVPDYFINSADRYLLSKLIYKLISSEILPVIFNTDDNRKKREKSDLDCDDITSDFVIAINNIKAVLESDDIASIMYRNAKMRDIDKTYDKDYESKVCNYGICICTDKMLRTPFSRWEHDPDILIKIDTNAKDNNMPENYKELLSELVSELDLLSGTGDNVFCVPDDYYDEEHREEISRFRILKSGPSPYIFPRYIYYVTKIDINNENEFKAKYPKCFNKYQFIRNLHEKAALALIDNYRMEICEYNQRVLDSIVDVVGQILSADYSLIFSGKIRTYEDCKKALCTMYCDFERSWNWFLKNGFDDTQIFAITVWLSEYAVNCFSEYIKGKTFSKISRMEDLTKENNKEYYVISVLRNSIGLMKMKDTASKIEGFFDKIDKIIELRDRCEYPFKDKLENLKKIVSICYKSDLYPEIKIDSANYLCDIDIGSNVFRNLKKSLVDFADVLNGKYAK